MAWLCHRWGFFSSEQARVVFTPPSLCLSLPASLIRQACWGCSGVCLGGTGVRPPGLTAFVRDRHGLGMRRAPPESRTVASQRGVAAQGPAVSFCCSLSGSLLHIPACRTLPSALLGASDLRLTSRPKEGLCSQARVEPRGQGRGGAPKEPCVPRPGWTVRSAQNSRLHSALCPG